MKKIIFIFVCFNLLITVAQSQSLLEKIDIIDNISDHMIKATYWESYVCPSSSFVDNPNWEEYFIYSAFGGNWAVKFYSKKHVDNISTRLLNKLLDNYKIIIDVSNLSIHYPFEDSGGSGRASGTSHQFSLFLKNIKEIDWEETDKTFILHLESNFDIDYKSPVAKYSRISVCNLLNFNFNSLYITFKKYNLNVNEKNELDKLLKKIMKW